MCTPSGLEVVLPASRSILLVCHANMGHLHMPVVGIVLKSIGKGKAQGLNCCVKVR